MAHLERKSSTATTYPNLPKVNPAVELNKPLSNDAINVFITTWNMGNAEATGLNNIFEEKGALQNDILCVGLQESTYTMGKQQQQQDCIAHLSAQLHAVVGNEFYLIEHCHRAQLQLFLFAKNSLKNRISNVEKYVENTGFLHVFPNKGGLLVTLSIDGTRLAFISCHLTAHEGVKHCEERNASIVEILGGARSGDERFDVTEQFHHVFWMGDMNYRLTFSDETPSNTKKNIANLNAAAKQSVVATEDVNVKVADPAVGAEDESSDSEHEDEGKEGEESHKSGKAAKKAEHRANRKKVLDMVKVEQWKELLELDELNREIKAGRILNQFTALQPNFPPTFKRSRQAILPLSMSEVDNFDDFYNEKRIPSFTDRILYKSLPAFAKCIQPLYFDSCERATSSDHKPVRAGFKLDICKGKEDIFVDRELITKAVHNGVRSLHLKVYNLKGFNLEDMDVGGGSDPYVLIVTDPPSLLMHRSKIVKHNNGVKSKVITKNLNPVWKDPMTLEIASLDLEGLSRNASLIFSVWDEDTFNADDLIGSSSVPFKDILESIFVKNKAFDFDLVLKSNAEIMGRLTGTVGLEGNPGDYLEAAKGFVHERGQQPAQPGNQQLPRFVHLARAEQEADSQTSGSCCTIV